RCHEVQRTDADDLNLAVGEACGGVANTDVESCAAIDPEIATITADETIIPVAPGDPWIPIRREDEITGGGSGDGALCLPDDGRQVHAGALRGSQLLCLRRDRGDACARSGDVVRGSCSVDQAQQ